jgi:hypothetical protein
MTTRFFGETATEPDSSYYYLSIEAVDAGLNVLGSDIDECERFVSSSVVSLSNCQGIDSDIVEEVSDLPLLEAKRKVREMDRRN